MPNFPFKPAPIFSSTMERRIQTIVIDSDSSDSDDIQIDESRSAPRRPVAPVAPGQMPPQLYMTGSRARPPAGGVPKIPGRTDPKRDQVQPAIHTAAHKTTNPSPSRRPKSSSASMATRLGYATARNLGRKKDYSDRRLSARQIRRCIVCVEDSRCCDGGDPCASCFDPGFPCVYPGEGNALLLPQLESSARERDHASAKRLPADSAEGRQQQAVQTDATVLSSVSGNIQAGSKKVSGNRTAFEEPLETTIDQPYNTRRSSGKPRRNIVNGAEAPVSNFESIQGHISTLADQDNIGAQDGDDDSDFGSSLTNAVRDLSIEQISMTSWLPSNFDEMQRLIQTHEANILSHREYIVEAQLADAKTKAHQTLRVDAERRGPNPFKKMIAEESTRSSARSNTFTLEVKSKVKRGDTTVELPANPMGEDDAAHMPEYRSIGRLRSTMLARNVHGLRYVPYNSGIEGRDLKARRDEMEANYKDHSSEEFRRQRECLELVYQWSNDFDEILQEVRLTPVQLWKWLGQSTLAKCQKCQTFCGQVPPSISLDFNFTRDEKQRCQWLYEAFLKIIKIGVWHFISDRPGQVAKKSATLQSKSEIRTKTEHTLCALCFTHNCMTHGSYFDPSKGEIDYAAESLINDSEERYNQRQKTVLSIGTKNLPYHSCGLYCLGDSFPGLQQAHKILGVDENDELKGLRNERIKLVGDLGPFHGKDPCANRCFINREDRPLRPNMTNMSLDKTTALVRQLLYSMSKLYCNHVRLPCMISKVANVDCMTAFFLVLQMNKFEHSRLAADEMTNTQTALDSRKVPTKVGVYNTSRSTLLGKRNAWTPCSHDGPCSSGNNDCGCAREQVHCEKSCGCPDGCRRQFRGCRCRNKCYNDNRCECFAASRECDPRLCHDCGVEEVLDPSNRYREDVRIGRCQNNRLQLNLPARTVKGMSEVQGWGLFLGEDLPIHTFVGEYRGEVISIKEADRRGAVYSYVGQEYLFDLDDTHRLDGSRFGNKTRFINNSNLKEYQNLNARVLLVNGVPRIGLYTNRAIKAGEELLYHYGYPDAVVEGEFWEKHDKAIEQNGVVTPIAKPKFRPRVAKNAGTPGGDDDDDDDDEDEEEESPIRKPALAARPKKRKRLLNIEIDDSDGNLEPVAAVRASIIRKSARSESSEYEESSHTNGVSSVGSVEEVAEDDEESEDGSEDELAKPVRTTDRRRGGEAQRRAALTRKLNKQRR